MKFFTDKTVENDYLLIKIQDYIKMNDFSKWKEILIDPGVYELTKSKKYSWEDSLDIKEFLESLPKNHYFSADYPSDMNPKFTKLFLKKSWNNAIKYHTHPQYLCTVQFKFNNYWNFREWFDKYNNLEIVSGYLGLGNLCRIHYKTEFMKHTLDYAFSHCKYPRIHIYGLAFRNIKYAYRLAKRFNIKLSIDSTKWTRAGDKKLKDKFKTIGCRNQEERQIFFNYYLNKIQKKGIKIENVFKSN